MTLIIQKERELTRKLEHVEKMYRLKGFNYDLNCESEDQIEIDTEKFLGKTKLPSIQEKSYSIKGELEIYTPDRKIFPILVLNPFKLKKIGEFTEIIAGSDVHFKHKSFKVIVKQRYYEKVKLILDNYLSFTEQPKVKELLDLRIPTEDIMEIIRIKKRLLFNKISNISSEDRLVIENIVDDVLTSGNTENINLINSINKILYFIDISFIKMIAPDYKEDLLAY